MSRGSAPTGPRKIRVMASPGPLEPGGNPFIQMLYAHLDEDIEVIDFSWKAIYFGPRVDVLHLHWPEYTIRSRSKSTTIVKSALFALLPVALRVRRVRAVWTVHNLRPHELSGMVEQWLLREWAQIAFSKVYLNGHSFREAHARRRQHIYNIPHGDYAPMLARLGNISHPPIANRLLLFGVLRPMKGIETAIVAVSESDSSDLVLRIAGQPVSESFGNKLKGLLKDNPRIRLDIGHLSDAELVLSILESEIVLLPYGNLFNSGALLLALSIGRPVIAIESETSRELQSEVGIEWLVLIPEMTEDALRVAVAQIRSTARESSPSFHGRDWKTIGEQYSAVYREARMERHVP